MTKNALKKMLSATVGLIIIFFLLRHVWTYWDILKNSKVSIKWTMILFSYFFGLLSFFIYSLAWHFMLRSDGMSVRFAVSNYMLTKGNLGKYIPGRVWQFVGRLYFFNDIGFSKARIIMIAALEQYFLMLSAFLIFGISFLFFQNILNNAFLIYLKIIIIVGLITGFLSLHPKSIVFWNRIFLKLTKREDLQIYISTKYIVLLISLYFIYWITIGLSVLFLIKGGLNIPVKYMLFVVGSNAIAYFVGYISFIIPNGLGVREGVLTYLLELFIVKGLGAVISILSRIMLVIEEIGYFILAFAFYKYMTKNISAESIKIKNQLSKQLIK
ncbi:MAG: lysylphosphatidylglycerol synthase transmembrane domain-containing protein [Nitrospirota bacterium]